MSSELIISGNVYRTDKLDTFKAFHLSRKVGPVLFALLREMAGDGDKTVDMIQTMLNAAGPLMGALSDMKMEDADFVLNTCLGVCYRQQDGKTWARVQVSPGTMQFDDIDMKVMMQLVMAVIKDNVGNFIDGSQGQPKPISP